MKVVYPNMSRPGQSQAIKAMLQKAAAVNPAAFSEMSFDVDYESHVILQFPTCCKLILCLWLAPPLMKTTAWLSKRLAIINQFLASEVR